MSKQIPILPLVQSVLNSEKFLDLFKGKKAKQIELEYEISKQLHQINLQQIEVNKIEASHKKIFVSGWRPFIGWVCGSALSYQFILQPFLLVILKAFKIDLEVPNLELSQLVSILFAMLGIYTTRTFEKIKLNKN